MRMLKNPRILAAALVCALAIVSAIGYAIDPALTLVVLSRMGDNLLMGGAIGVGIIGATVAPFPIQPDLTAIALMYRNKRMIADQVLPRVQVAKGDFKYFTHTLADGFTIPDTKVGRRSPPNQVEFTATETTASTTDYALDDSIPNADIANASNIPGADPVAKATMYVANLIELDREKRTADLVFGAGNYAAANKTTLSGTGQWSDYTNSNPISAILTALDGSVMRPNIAVMGRTVFSALIQHPKVLAAIYGPGGTRGIATAEQLANVLELDAVYVGESYVNSAKKGQTVSLARVWGKFFALLYRDTLADAARGTTFGFTAQFGTRIAGSFEDKDIGMRGGVRVRVGESVKEVIAANDLGYLFSAAIA